MPQEPVWKGYNASSGARGRKAGEKTGAENSPPPLRKHAPAVPSPLGGRIG